MNFSSLHTSTLIILNRFCWPMHEMQTLTLVSLQNARVIFPKGLPEPLSLDHHALESWMIFHMIHRDAISTLSQLLTAWGNTGPPKP